jgi:hypothetical protein
MSKKPIMIWVYKIVGSTIPERPEYAVSIAGIVNEPFDSISSVASFIKKSALPQKTGARVDIVCKPVSNMYLMFGKNPVKHEALSLEEQKEFLEKLSYPSGSASGW